jgi:hypothetical protein
MNQKKGKKLNRAKKIKDFLCPFSLRLTRAKSALKQDKQPSTLRSSLLNNQSFLSFEIDQHMIMIIFIAKGLLMALLK